MTQESKQLSSSEARPAEVDRLWEAIERLTEIQHKGEIQTVELRSSVKTLCEKIDNMICYGTNRCSDHHARIETMEKAHELLNTGDHPACVAHAAKLKNWIYASFITAGTSFIGMAIALFKVFF